MDTVEVFQLDGTIQCRPTAPEITLEEMREQLTSLIGAGNVLGMEKRSLPVIALCGMPTGRANVYELSREGWLQLERGIVGNPGFELWPTDDALGVHGGEPTRIAEMIGRPVRLYQTGQPLTYDHRPERVNIETSPRGETVRVWFG